MPLALEMKINPGSQGAYSLREKRHISCYNVDYSKETRVEGKKAEQSNPIVHVSRKERSG